jgi:osmotically-inducible protein OsmY
MRYNINVEKPLSQLKREVNMMNKLNLIARFLLGFILILSVSGCAGTKTVESTGEYFDDAIISTKIRTSILADSKLSSTDITVTTFKGVVQLSGFVDSKVIADRAVQIARTVNGVKAVNNSLVSK